MLAWTSTPGYTSATGVALLWLNGWLLFTAFMAVAFAASVSFDRLAPALGVSLVFVLVNYLANAGAAAETVEQIAGAGGRAMPLQFDVTDAAAVKAAIERAVEETGRLDVLVNNAGVAVDGLVARLKDADWARAIAINLTGVFHCARAALRPMLKARYGRVVSVTSVVGETGNAGQAAYAAAKAGVVGFTRSLAREVASRGITVNAVAPGFVDTEMTATLDEGQRSGYGALIPLGRPATAEEVAAAVAFLASPAAGYVTGHVLHVNGGLYM